MTTEGRRITAAILALASLACAFPNSTRADERAFHIVVHPGNPVMTLRRADVAELFLKKVKRWKHSIDVEPVDQSERSAVRAEFAKSVLGRSTGDLRAYWEQQVMNGGANPPRVRATDDEVIRHIQQTPGAIGYVSAQAKLDGVRVVQLEP